MENSENNMDNNLVNEKNKSNSKVLISIIICLTILVFILSYFLFIKGEKRCGTPDIIPTESTISQEQNTSSVISGETSSVMIDEPTAPEKLTSEQILKYLNTQFVFVEDAEEISPIIGLLSFNYEEVDSKLMDLHVLDYSDMLRYSAVDKEKLNEICKGKTGYTLDKYKKKYGRDFSINPEVPNVFADIDKLKEIFMNITGNELVISKDIKENKYYKYNAILSLRSDELHTIDSIKSVEITSHEKDIYNIDYVANISYSEEEETTTGNLKLRQDGELLYIISNHLEDGEDL